MEPQLELAAVPRPSSIRLHSGAPWPAAAAHARPRERRRRWAVVRPSCFKHMMMETDRIRTNMDLDISNNYIYVFF